MRALLSGPSSRSRRVGPQESLDEFVGSDNRGSLSPLLRPVLGKGQDSRREATVSRMALRYSEFLNSGMVWELQNDSCVSRSALEAAQRAAKSEKTWGSRKNDLQATRGDVSVGVSMERRL